MNMQPAPVANLLHRIEGRIEQWRRQDALHKAEAQANRERLWEEALERERLLREALSREEGEERSFEEVSGEQGTVFVVHSREAGRVLERFAAEGGRLVRVIPGGVDGRQTGEICGSWLIFSRER